MSSKKYSKEAGKFMEITLQQIQECINNNIWAEAKELLTNNTRKDTDGNLDDVYYILEAILSMNEQNYPLLWTVIQKGYIELC
jgi:hypothetical protein